MDYLGESGIGAWQYGTPEQAKMAEGMSGAMAAQAWSTTCSPGWLTAKT